MKGMLRLEKFWLACFALALLEGAAALGILFYLGSQGLNLGRQFSLEVRRITEVTSRLSRDAERLTDLAYKFNDQTARITDVAFQAGFDVKRVSDHLLQIMGSSEGNRITSATDSLGPLKEKDVRAFLEDYIMKTRNPNLELGRIRELDHYFEATITTKDKSLVDKIMIDKAKGWARSIYSSGK